MYAIAAGLEGFMLTNLNIPLRIIAVAAGLMLIYPGITTDIIGTLIIVVIFILEIRNKKAAAVNT